MARESLRNWLTERTRKMVAFLRPLWHIARVMLLFALVLVAIMIVTLVGTHIYLVFEKPAPALFRWMPDFVLGLLFGSNATELKETQYGAIVSDMIAGFAFVVTVATVLQTFLYKRRVQREYTQRLMEAKSEYEKKTGINSQPIKIAGDDDLIWMLVHYREADEITIFGGGFEWLKKNKEMRKIVCSLAQRGKLKLVSYRSEGEVKRAFIDAGAKDLFNDVKECLKYDSQTGKVVCTMIKKSATESKFLYKSRDTGGHAFNACVMNDTDSTRELLHILAALTNADHWGEMASTATEAS